MSDLYIEARLQAIKDIASASCADIKDADNISSFCDEIYSAIPNIDRIVEELEALKDGYDHSCLDNAYQRGVETGAKWMKKKTIEIVKQGGVGIETETIRDKAVKWNNNSSKRVPYEFIDYVEGKRNIGVSDDVCEWKYDGVFLNSPHKPLVSCVTEESYRYYYCPVCGKKIKAVE